MRAVAGWFGRILAALVILGAVGVLAVSVVVPRVAGATPYTVLTGSMRPDYPPGTLVVVRPVESDEIRVGDVITYQLKSGEPTVVTHRVEQVATSLAGEVRFITKGDANNVPDEPAVRPVQVRGELWYSVPYLGRLNSVLNGQQRELAALSLGLLLLVYAAFQLTSAARDRVRAREEVDA